MSHVDVKLVIFRPDGTRKDITLKPGRYVVGRNQDANLRIPLPSVSRKHCEISYSAGKLEAKDLGSSNGTYCNHARITTVSLKAGDVLGIGPCLMTVQINGQPELIEPPAHVGGADDASMATPPAGSNAIVEGGGAKPGAGGKPFDPDETVTKGPGMGSIVPPGSREDSSIFDFDFDFEDDDKPKKA
ncbi:MAG: FHA domain-containing protein [Phycisphaerales bacterium]|nr:FHA domain-containing protein [Phycisphaerales bacterium]